MSNNPLMSFWTGMSSPAKNVGYEWPNLYEETREMLEGSILIYAFADIRSLARQGLLSDSHNQLLTTLPIDPAQIITVVQENQALLHEHIGKDDTDFYLSALSSLQENLAQQQSQSADNRFVFGGTTTLLHSSQVVAFDDENSQDELVYGVVVNSARKRITVGFRGSVTTNDFLTDAKGFLTEIPNPVVSGAGIPQSSTVGVHHGFRDYLFGSSRLKRGWNSEQSKYDKIMQQLINLLESNPDYRIYVTGHSLGGALATLFAFEAAASVDPRLTKPISCITVASPKVGGLQFRRAFQALERQGVIRCLRIANFKDLVTLLPDRGSLSCLYITCCQANVFRHVGTELKLFRSGKFRLSRPTETTSYIGMLCYDWITQVQNAVSIVVTLPCVFVCQEDFLSTHGCREYLERLHKSESKTKALYLNKLYEDQSKVYTTN